MSDEQRIKDLEAKVATMSAALERVIDLATDSLQGFDRERQWGNYMRRIIRVADDAMLPAPSVDVVRGSEEA